MTISSHPRLLLVIVSVIAALLYGCDSGSTPSTSANAPVSSVPSPQPVISLTFGIVPQQSASKLAGLWIPIMEHVGKEAGVKLEFKTAPDIPEFEKRCRDGIYQIAYMNPFHYTEFHKAPGYIAVAKQKGKKIQGILVAKKEYVVDKDFKVLSGETLAFPAPDAFAATKLPTADLENKNIEFGRKYVNSHDSVYRAVAQGLYPAGGGIIRTFRNVAEDVSSQLKIIHRTKQYTPHAFAIHPSVDPGTRSRIADALINLEATARGRELLNSIKFDGIETAKNEDWEDVRKIDLSPIIFQD